MLSGANASARKANAPLAGQRGQRTFYWLVLRTAPY